MVNRDALVDNCVMVQIQLRDDILLVIHRVLPYMKLFSQGNSQSY